MPSVFARCLFIQRPAPPSEVPVFSYGGFRLGQAFLSPLAPPHAVHKAENVCSPHLKGPVSQGASNCTNWDYDEARMPKTKDLYVIERGGVLGRPTPFSAASLPIKRSPGAALPMMMKLRSELWRGSFLRQSPAGF